LSPAGSGFQQVGLVFAGFVVICTSLKFLVQSAEKRRKDKPMKQAFVLGLRSVLATFWAIATSYTAAALPG
jgi:hypothetical protein